MKLPKTEIENLRNELAIEKRGAEQLEHQWHSASDKLLMAMDAYKMLEGESEKLRAQVEDALRFYAAHIRTDVEGKLVVNQMIDEDRGNRARRALNLLRAKKGTQ